MEMDTLNTLSPPSQSEEEHTNHEPGNKCSTQEQENGSQISQTERVVIEKDNELQQKTKIQDDDMSSSFGLLEKQPVENLLWAVVAGIADGSHDEDDDDATTVTSGSRRTSDEGMDLSSLPSILSRCKIDVDYGDVWEIDDFVNQDDYYPARYEEGGDYGTATTPSLEVSAYSTQRSSSSAPDLVDDEPVPAETRHDLILLSSLDDDEDEESNFGLTIYQDDDDDNDTLSTLTRETKLLPHQPIILLRHGSLRSRETPTTASDKQDSASARLTPRFDRRSRLRSTDPADPDDVPAFDVKVLLRRARE